MLSSLGLIEPLLYGLPLWAVAILIFVACLLMREVGAYIYRRVAAGRPKSEKDEKDGEDSSEPFTVGSIFGLLAFIIGLTFSIALDRYESRRLLVAEEANAISTTYLRAALLDEPYRSQIQATLREYAHSRIAPQGLWNDEMEERLKHSLALRRQLWDESRAAIMPVRETELGSYFVEAVNDTLNVGTRRQLAGRAHVPSRILDVLVLYLLVAAASLGYLMKDKQGGRRQASTVLLLLFTVAIVLILDLDRPRTGTIRVPQGALEDLVATLDREAARPVPSALPAPATATPAPAASPR